MVGAHKLKPDCYKVIATAIEDAAEEISRKRQHLFSEDSRPRKKQKTCPEPGPAPSSRDNRGWGGG
jgi:hypothetical protein